MNDRIGIVKIQTLLKTTIDRKLWRAIIAHIHKVNGTWKKGKCTKKCKKCDLITKLSFSADQQMNRERKAGILITFHKYWILNSQNLWKLMLSMSFFFYLIIHFHEQRRSTRNVYKLFLMWILSVCINLGDNLANKIENIANKTII